MANGSPRPPAVGIPESYASDKIIMWNGDPVDHSIYSHSIYKDPSISILESRLAELEKLVASLMAPLPSIKSSDAFMIRLCEVMRIDPSRVSRIVMDLQVGKPMKCFIEYFGGEELLRLEIPSELEIYTVKDGSFEVSHTF
jgi:hypothetical protein